MNFGWQKKDMNELIHYMYMLGMNCKTENDWVYCYDPLLEREIEIERFCCTFEFDFLCTMQRQSTK